MKNVLTIAGSDSSGGAGIQADIKTMSALGVFGMSAITALTAQNTSEVRAVMSIPSDFVVAQIAAVFDDIRVHAVKVGMIVNSEIARAVADFLFIRSAKNIVIDPVMVAKSGGRLIDASATKETMRLAKIATIITPNIYEAELLSGKSITSQSDMEKAAKIIQEQGIDNVIVKGGASRENADDYLLCGDEGEWLRCPRIPTNNIHGAGCTLSSAIACYLARGHSTADSVHKAKDFVTHAIRHSIPLGKGNGPLGHLSSLYQKARRLTSPTKPGQEQR